MVVANIQDEKFPNNNIYIKDISKITIFFDKEATLKDLPFCYRYVNFINFNKNNTMETYVIFTSSLQLNLMKKATQIFIDGTFRINPKGFYQVLNIGAFIPDINEIFPILLMPTSGKSEVLYDNIFKDIKNILFENNINLSNITNKFMIDFEVALQNDLK